MAYFPPNDLTASGNITTQNLNPSSGTATAGSTVAITGLNGQGTLIFNILGTYTGALSVQIQVDGTNWVSLSKGVTDVLVGSKIAPLTSAQVGTYQVNISGATAVRISAVSGAQTGTATVSARVTYSIGILPAELIIGSIAPGYSANPGALPVVPTWEYSQDGFITGQGAQSASGNNILNVTAGAGAIDTGANGSSYFVSAKSFYCQIIGSAGIASGQVIFEGSNDNTTFVALTVYDDAVVTGAPINTAQSIAASTNRFFSGKVSYRYLRCRISTVFSGGTVQAIVRLSQSDYTPRITTVAQATAANLNATIGSGTVTTVTTLTTLANGQTAHSSASTGSPIRIGGRVSPTTAATQDATLVAGDASDIAITTGQQVMTKDFATAENDWQSAAAASGISNTTTAVTFKAASGTANIRNYITAIQIEANVLGGATELAIRDGAAGTVIWRTQLQTGGSTGINIVFPTPLRGTANTLLEVVTLTAVTGNVYFNAQGYTGF